MKKSVLDLWMESSVFIATKEKNCTYFAWCSKPQNFLSTFAIYLGVCYLKIQSSHGFISESYLVPPCPNTYLSNEIQNQTEHEKTAFQIHIFYGVEVAFMINFNNL